MDSSGQLTEEASTRHGGYTDAFTYDAAGNPTLFKGVTLTPYNSNNQLTATGYAYDGNGNPTTYQGNTLTFDPDNHLNEFRTAQNVVLMAAGYNGDGLRAWK